MRKQEGQNIYLQEDIIKKQVNWAKEPKESDSQETDAKNYLGANQKKQKGNHGRVFANFP